MIDVRTSWNGCQPMPSDVRLCQAVGHQFGTRIASEQFPEFVDRKLSLAQDRRQRAAGEHHSRRWRFSMLTA